MKPFSNILLAADSTWGGKPALRRAVRLARHHQSRLTVAGICETLHHETPVTGREGAPAHPGVIQLARDLETFVQPFRRSGIDINTRVLCGIPHVEIIRDVIQNRHDFVIISDQKKFGIKETLFGRPAEHLIGQCPCPVLVHRSTRTDRSRRILAALWPNPFDEENDALNAVIMNLAVTLARQENATLHVVRTWKFKDEGSLRGWEGLSWGQEAEILHTADASQRAWLESFLKGYPVNDLKLRTDVLHGEAAQLIPELAKQDKADLIVMGALHRSVLAEFFSVSTAQHVLSQVDCTVMTVLAKDVARVSTALETSVVDAASAPS